MVNRAYLVFVALDENEHPVPVPRLILETEEERQEWEAELNVCPAKTAPVGKLLIMDRLYG